ncbi:MAG: aspartate kinase [Pseudonocardia sp.]
MATTDTRTVAGTDPTGADPTGAHRTDAAPTGADPISVWKFGGSSVADPERLQAAARRIIAERARGRRVVAVLSAMGRSTDELVDLAYKLSDRPQLRELDALLSVGEQISCSLAAMTINALGVPAISLTGEQAGVHTDDQHGNARLAGVDAGRIARELDEGNIVLVAGFQGMSPGGDTTTLGRGGSDASAVAVAAALGLTECEVFTDVAGVFTADPKVVPAARRLDTLRHDEMLEMAEAGAAVLQPRSVELAAAHGVHIHLRSSFTDGPGTWIRSGTIGAPDVGIAPGAESTWVTAVAHRNQDTLYSVPGVSPARVVGALAARGAAVGSLQPAGCADRPEVRFTAPGVEPAEVVAALAGIGGTRIGAEAHVRDDLGSVSVVATGIARRPAVTAAALAALEDAAIPCEFVTTTAGRLSVHVNAADVHEAVRVLHRLFVEGS